MKKVIFTILDGFGIREEKEGNPVFHKSFTNWDLTKRRGNSSIRYRN